MAGTPIEPVLYYKLRAAQLQLALIDSQYQQRRAELLAALQGLLREAGVDPVGVYQCVDESCTLVPITPH
jgi:hypothetical protein